MGDDMVRLLRDNSLLSYAIGCYLVSGAKKAVFLVSLHFKLSLYFVPGLQFA